MKNHEETFHIGYDYKKAFLEHYQSSEGRALFEEARKLKNAERDVFLKKHNSLKQKRFLMVIIVIGVVVFYGYQEFGSFIDEFIPELMDNPLLGVLMIGLVFFTLAGVVRRSKADKKTTIANKERLEGEYAEFYLDKILPWLVKPLNIHDFKLVVKKESSGRSRTPVNRLQSIRYSISGTRAMSSVHFIEESSGSAIEGHVWRTQFKVARPLPYDIRIENTEGFVRQGIKATANMLKSSAHKFEFNSIEMAKMFDCYITTGKNRERGNHFDSVFESNRLLGVAAGMMAKKAQKHMPDIEAASTLGELAPEVGDFIGDFLEAGASRSPEAIRQKMEDNLHNAHAKITPMLEEVLLFIRHKYGPYHLTASENVQIDIAKEQNLVNKINVRQEGMRPEKAIDLFIPTLLDDSDISCERMLAIYEVFLLGFLLDKHFNEKE